MSQVYKNLGIVTKKPYLKTIRDNMPKKIMVEYTQPSFSDPGKVWSVGLFNDDKTDVEVKKRIKALEVGQEICVHTRKNDKGYSELVDVSDKSDVPQKKSGGGGWKGGGNKRSADKFDGDGAQVGNALTNAAALLPEGASADDLESMAWEIILRGEALKKRLKDLREGKVEAKPEQSRANKAEAELEEVDFGDDDVDFDDDIEF